MKTTDDLTGVGTLEERAALTPFRSASGLRRTLRADLRANRRDPKSQLVMVGLRCCQYLMYDRDRPRRRSLLAVALYRLVTEFVLGIELRPKTRVGPGLTIFHGTGLVVNDQALIGSGVTLRNGVVIGHKNSGERSPFIRDGANLGAAALVIGAITVGKNARVGAGAVVVHDVPDEETVVGNPARSVVR